ncbi:hypothetical protein RRSWK_05414 [Rhodopirellula sp. SWK7]|nr:hypothetical protein RRSWK_05414 [Rhodopirellula sp. SWK7]
MKNTGKPVNLSSEPSTADRFPFEARLDLNPDFNTLRHVATHEFSH